MVVGVVDIVVVFGDYFIPEILCDIVVVVFVCEFVESCCG